MRKTKALEQHKRQVQEAFDFAVTVCFSMPILDTSLKGLATSAKPTLTPHYFSPNQNSVGFLQTGIRMFEERLATFLFLSIFSFFEDFVKNVLDELFAFHGGQKRMIDLATKRDEALAKSFAKPQIEEYKSKLRKRVHGRGDKYRKYSKLLRAESYRFPTEWLSAFGVRMLAMKIKRLKAVEIPDLLKNGLGVPLSDHEITAFDKLRDTRNKIAHGKAVKLDLAIVSRANDSLRDMTFVINDHLLKFFFVIEDYAY